MCAPEADRARARSNRGAKRVAREDLDPANATTHLEMVIADHAQNTAVAGTVIGMRGDGIAEVRVAQERHREQRETEHDRRDPAGGAHAYDLRIQSASAVSTTAGA